jgi:hypothetical protein
MGPGCPSAFVHSSRVTAAPFGDGFGHAQSRVPSFQQIARKQNRRSISRAIGVQIVHLDTGFLGSRDRQISRSVSFVGVSTSTACCSCGPVDHSQKSAGRSKTRIRHCEAFELLEVLITVLWLTERWLCAERMYMYVDDVALKKPERLWQPPTR